MGSDFAESVGNSTILDSCWDVQRIAKPYWGMLIALWTTKSMPRTVHNTDTLHEVTYELRATDCLAQHMRYEPCHITRSRRKYKVRHLEHAPQDESDVETGPQSQQTS